MQIKKSYFYKDKIVNSWIFAAYLHLLIENKKSIIVSSKLNWFKFNLIPEETKPISYQSRRLDKPYHIDYVYAAKESVIALQIGGADKWLELSDHMPLTFEF